MRARIAFVVCGLVVWLGCWLAIEFVTLDDSWSLLIGFGIGLLGVAVFWGTYGFLTLLFE